MTIGFYSHDKKLKYYLTAIYVNLYVIIIKQVVGC